MHALAIEDGNLIELCKLMNAKGAISKNEVAIEIKLPLADQQLSDLFRVIRVLTVKN